MAADAPLKQTFYEDVVDLTAWGGPVVKDRFGLWPKQQKLFEATARYVCWGGAVGPGKTYGLAQKGKAKMLRWPGIPILVLRKDLKDLKLTTMLEYLNVTPKAYYDPKYGGQFHKGENWLRYFNGSTAYFGELKDWESYKSMNVGYVQIDEATEVEEEGPINLDARLRWTTGKGVCKRDECRLLGEDFAREHPEHPRYQIDLCTNPAPGWVKERFWRPWREGHERPDHQFIPATWRDNPSLPPDYVPKLLQSHDPQWVRNFLEGDWASFENMVWPTFNRGSHVLRGPLPYGSLSDVEGGIDYGGVTEDAHRTCAYLIGRLPNGQYLAFSEYSKQGAAAKDFFAQLPLTSRQFRVNGWDADSSQHRANELLRGGGVPVYDSDRSKGAVKDGINQVHRLFTLDSTKRPGLLIHESCERLIAGIETYQLDPDTRLPKKNQPDDEVNAFRYAVMRVTKERLKGGSTELSVRNGYSGGEKGRPSSIIKRIREDRRGRLRAVIARQDSDLRKQGLLK